MLLLEMGVELPVKSRRLVGGARLDLLPGNRTRHRNVKVCHSA